MPQHVTVVDYDPTWPHRYREERDRIAGILGCNALAIYHIGSTSVPELAAKPIIDILVVVRDLADMDAVASDFAALGYEYLGEFGMPGRRYLRRGGDERTHQIHAFQKDNMDAIVRHLAFCAYLRVHEREREAYARLKRDLARRFPYDIDGYCDGKEHFVRELEVRALAWYDSTWDRLYLAARNVQRPREISPLVEAGGVAAALITERGSKYVGVCIDTACSLGMCAERNAIANMITNGESKIKRIVAVMPDGRVGVPCGSCRELMMQLDASAADIEVLCDYERGTTARLARLSPAWWGDEALGCA